MKIRFLEKHLALSHLSPYHENPTIFIASQWQSDKTRPNIKYLSYRTLHILFLFTTLILSLKGPWYVFLTNWGYILCNIQSALCFLMVLVSFLGIILKRPSKLQENILKIHPFYWIMHVQATPLGFLITFVYWTLLHDYSSPFNLLNFFVHGSNSIMLMLDLWIVAHPVRILHFVYPVLFGTVYLVFSIAYHFYDKARGGTGWIYNILDWDYPGSTTGVVIGVVLFLILVHCLTYQIYRMKSFIYCRYVETKSTQSTENLDVYLQNV